MAVFLRVIAELCDVPTLQEVETLASGNQKALQTVRRWVRVQDIPLLRLKGWKRVFFHESAVKVGLNRPITEVAF